jgi:predicted Zn-dependent protease
VGGKSENQGLAARLVLAGGLLAIAALFPVRPAFAHAAIEVQIQDVTRRIAKDPGNARLFLQRAELHRDHADWDAAEADYRTARHLDPGLAEVDLRLGRMLLDKGEPALAKPELDRYVAGRPEDPRGLTLRARTLARLGRRDEAAADYRRALASPAARGAGDPDAFLELADLLSTGDRPRREEALEVLERGIAALGPIVSLELPAIEIEVALGRYDAALSRVDGIASQSGRKERWILERAGILRQAGRSKEAEAAYREVLRSIAALPEDRRATPMVKEMAAKAYAGLGRVAAASDESRPDGRL